MIEAVEQLENWRAQHIALRHPRDAGAVHAEIVGEFFLRHAVTLKGLLNAVHEHIGACCTLSVKCKPNLSTS